MNLELGLSDHRSKFIDVSNKTTRINDNIFGKKTPTFSSMFYGMYLFIIGLRQILHTFSRIFFCLVWLFPKRFKVANYYLM